MVVPDNAGRSSQRSISGKAHVKSFRRKLMKEQCSREILEYDQFATYKEGPFFLNNSESISKNRWSHCCSAYTAEGFGPMTNDLKFRLRMN